LKLRSVDLVFGGRILARLSINEREPGQGQSLEEYHFWFGTNGFEHHEREPLLLCQKGRKTRVKRTKRDLEPEVCGRELRVRPSQKH